MAKSTVKKPSQKLPKGTQVQDTKAAAKVTKDSATKAAKVPKKKKQAK